MKLDKDLIKARPPNTTALAIAVPINDINIPTPITNPSRFN